METNDSHSSGQTAATVADLAAPAQVVETSDEPGGGVAVEATSSSSSRRRTSVRDRTTSRRRSHRSGARSSTPTSKSGPRPKAGAHSRRRGSSGPSAVGGQELEVYRARSRSSDRSPRPNIKHESPSPSPPLAKETEMRDVVTSLVFAEEQIAAQTSEIEFLTLERDRIFALSQNKDEEIYYQQMTLAELRQEDEGSEIRVQELDRRNQNLSQLAAHINTRYEQMVMETAEENTRRMTSLEEAVENRHLTAVGALRREMEVMEMVNNRMSEQANVAHNAVVYYESEAHRNAQQVEDLTGRIRVVAVESEAMIGEADRRYAQECQELRSVQEFAEKAHNFQMRRVGDIQKSLKQTEAKLMAECEKSEANLGAYRQLETVIDEAESSSRAHHMRKLSEMSSEYREMYAEVRKEKERLEDKVFYQEDEIRKSHKECDELGIIVQTTGESLEKERTGHKALKEKYQTLSEERVREATFGPLSPPPPGLGTVPTSLSSWSQVTPIAAGASPPEHIRERYRIFA